MKLKDALLSGIRNRAIMRLCQIFPNSRSALFV
jgi:hypothetical protein